ncbi:MAG: hypothetical protein ACI9QC_000015 [Oceanicoccus sp.]|jgi:hypothetical protein
MNAERKEQSPSQGSTEKAGQVVNFLEARLQKEMQTGGINKATTIAAPYLAQVNEIGFVRGRHDELMAMPDEVRTEFLKILADRTIDVTMYEAFKQKLRLLLPAGIAMVTYDAIKDGSYAAMLMLGLIGNERIQEAFAARANPGMIENILGKALPIIAKFDIEPDSRIALEFIAKAIKVKGITLETLRQLRAKVRNAEGAKLSLESTLTDIESAANSALLPHANHKTREEMHLEAATGPVPPMTEEQNLALGKAFGPSEIPEA